jgi:hypothetical protein
MCYSLQPYQMLDVKLFTVVLSLLITYLLIIHFGPRLVSTLRKERSQFFIECVELAQRLRTLFTTKDRMVQAYDKVRHPQ